MEGEPNSHPSNPIHKEALASESGKKAPQNTDSPVQATNAKKDASSSARTASDSTSHDLGKIGLIIVGGLEAFAVSHCN